MKYVLLTLGFVAGFYWFVPTDANAVVCARGYYRSGCAGPNGAVVRRHGYGYVAPRRVYPARRVYVAPARRCYWNEVRRVRVCT